MAMNSHLSAIAAPAIVRCIVRCLGWTPGLMSIIVMVGDRFHDGEVAMKANIPFIGCTYGFGDDEELAMASACVSAPKDIPSAVREVLS